ncbi:MAG: tRNA pseudouridine(38-40) synthase TruA [Propionibacteriaceae bacterium]|jgi:tRNA pseudouridine38-40 synthase|nr:tRNA pseudouridine(38-40) synthase TruA [Propionibacteriaceae bacterium]
MTRWRIDLAYDGTDFAGWAAQPGQRTVQGVLEEWLGRLLGAAETLPKLTVAGRTDAGVHAQGQVAHLDVPEGARLPPKEVARRLGQVLPSDIVVKAVSEAPVGFDARFAAIWRRYSYRIWDAVSRPDPLLRRTVTQFPEPLDIDAMNQAAMQLLGLRDFAAFCKHREGATTIRELRVFSIVRADDACRTIEATLVADAFCHSMVRSLLGAVTQVGFGRRDLDWICQVRDATSRASSVPVLPPHGLTLAEVGYPSDADLTARVGAARNVRTLNCCEEA